MDARELTRDEKKKIRTLVTGMCANYDRESGLCLPLDCACYMLHKCWTGAYCRYFREAVLPLDPELQASLTTEGISIGFTRTPFCITSKCRWLPVLSPVLPTYPITCPAVTASPAVTAVCVMWA